MGVINTSSIGTYGRRVVNECTTVSEFVYPRLSLSETSTRAVAYMWSELLTFSCNKM